MGAEHLPKNETMPPELPRPAAPRRFPFMLAVPALFFLSACGDNGEEAESADRGPRAAPVVIVEEAKPATVVRRDVVLPGRVQAVTQAELSFLVGGRLEAILVAEGERVEAGQEIARIDDEDYQVELRQARTTEATAAADLARRRLLNRERILSRAMVEEAEATLAQATARREAAERQVMYAVLRAPYPGTVGRRVADVGTTVAAGAAIVTMVDGEAIDVVVDVPAAEAVRLPFGPELQGEGVVVGVVDEIEIALAYAEHSTVPDEQARTYRLVMRGRPPQGFNLLPGMAVRVTVADPRPRELPSGDLRVPVSAVVSQPGGRSAVFVVADGDRARRVPVEVIRMERDEALVRGEFAEGANVVVGGVQQLTDDAPVRPSRRD